MDKQVEAVKTEGKKLVIKLYDTELNSDWIRSARLDPDSKEAKKRDENPMVEEKEV